MKTLENKTTAIPKSEGEKMKYSDLALACVNQQSQQGFTIDEMRKRIRLAENIEKSGDTLELEDADYTKLKELVEAMTWGLVHKDIVQFVDDINAQQ